MVAYIGRPARHAAIYRVLYGVAPRQDKPGEEDDAYGEPYLPSALAREPKKLLAYTHDGHIQEQTDKQLLKRGHGTWMNPEESSEGYNHQRS